MDYEIHYVYPGGFMNTAHPGELHIVKRIKRKWLWDTWETVEVIRRCEPDVSIDMYYCKAVNSLCKWLKSPWDDCRGYIKE